MKLLLATVSLLVLGTVAEAGAPQAPTRHVVNPSGRYWLSEDLNRLNFWQVRAPEQTSDATVDASR